MEERANGGSRSNRPEDLFEFEVSLFCPQKSADKPPVDSLPAPHSD
jgi:hypothetical protein